MYRIPSVFNTCVRISSPEEAAVSNGAKTASFGCRNITIENCIIENCGTGIYGRGVDGLKIKGTKFIDNLGPDIDLANTRNVQISRNVFKRRSSKKPKRGAKNATGTIYRTGSGSIGSLPAAGA